MKAFSVLKILIALSNFSSLLRVTLIWRPRRPSHMLKETILLHDILSFEWWTYLFRRVICSFAVNNNSCYEARTPTNSPFHAPPVCYVTFCTTIYRHYEKSTWWSFGRVCLFAFLLVLLWRRMWWHGLFTPSFAKTDCSWFMKTLFWSTIQAVKLLNILTILACKQGGGR